MTCILVILFLFLLTLSTSFAQPNNLRMVSNVSLHREEHSTVKLDCHLEQHLLVAWRVNLHHETIYRYYYLDRNLRQQFLHAHDQEEKSREVLFENHRQTMVLLNVRLWMNSAWENIQCLVFNNQTMRFEMQIFYLHIYVSPFSLRLNLNQHSMRDASLFSFVDRQDLRVTCEVSSYPRSTLQFIFNHQPLLPLDETVDCISEDLAIIPLGKSMCLSQTNWRIRVRISTVIHLRNEHDGQTLTCALRDFPYGNAWNSSLGVQFIRKAENLSTSGLSFVSSTSITEQTSSNFVFVTLSTAETTSLQQSKQFPQGNLYKSALGVSVTLAIIAIVLAGYVFKTKRKRKVLNINNTIQPRF